MLHEETPTGPWAFLFRGVRRNRLRMAGFMGLLTLWQLCETFVPVMIGLVIDRAVATSDWSRLAFWGGGLVLLFVVLSFAYRFGARMGFWVVQHEMHRIRLEIAAHALHPRGARTKLLPGEVLSLATADTDNVGYAIRSLGYTLASVSSLVLSAWVLLSIDLGLGLVVLIGVPVVVAIIQLATPAIARRTTVQQEKVGRATGVATDLVRGLRVLKGVGGEREAGRRYRLVSREAQVASIHSAQSWGTLAGLTTLTSGGFLALIALLAGNLALEGDITIGELVMVVGLTQYLAEPLEFVGGISAQAARAHASARRITDYLRTPPLVAAGALEPAAPAVWQVGGELGLRLVSQPGELLGLAVDDPAAAGALVRALAEGSPNIVVDGCPLDELSDSARRAHLVVNPHHVDLFEGTLRSNVDPDGHLSDEQLAAVLDASAAADVVELAVDGVDQPITPDGATFSGGQRQRIALARALASRAPLLVLHDPTTAVDSVTEHRIATGIRSLRHPDDQSGDRFDDRFDEWAGRTTWLVTNAPALLAQADRVLLVRDGRVVAEGTHKDLAADDAYRELVLR